MTRHEDEHGRSLHDPADQVLHRYLYELRDHYALPALCWADFVSRSACCNAPVWQTDQDLQRELARQPRYNHCCACGQLCELRSMANDSRYERGGWNPPGRLLPTEIAPNQYAWIYPDDELFIHATQSKPRESQIERMWQAWKRIEPYAVLIEPIPDGMAERRWGFCLSAWALCLRPENDTFEKVATIGAQRLARLERHGPWTPDGVREAVKLGRVTVRARMRGTRGKLRGGEGASVPGGAEARSEPDPGGDCAGDVPPDLHADREAARARA